MKKKNWLPLFLMLFVTYFLSSIPGLRVLPVFRQVNNFLKSIDLSMTYLAARIAERLPGELSHARTFTEDFLIYARENPVIIEFILRKSAHVILFFLITIAFFLLLRHYFRNLWLAAVVSFFGATLVAFLDEYHQSFVPDRAGSLVDVAIDMLGVSLATALLFFSLFLTGRYRR